MLCQLSTVAKEPRNFRKDAPEPIGTDTPQISEGWQLDLWSDFGFAIYSSSIANMVVTGTASKFFYGAFTGI